MTAVVGLSTSLLDRVRRYPVAAFFALAYVVSWGYWIPVAVAGGRMSHFPGLLGPLVSAVFVTAATGGAAGVGQLFRRMARWRIPVRFYLGCLLLPVAAAVAIAGMALVGADTPSWQELSSMPGLPELGWFPVFVMVLVVNGYGEETGWRGFAWSRLRQGHGVGGASLLLGIPWAVWHIPTLWIDSGMRGFPLLMLPGFLAGMAAGAVVLGWLYEHGRSSIALVAVWHAVLNMFSGTKGAEGAIAVAVSTVFIVGAIGILRRERTGLDGATAGVHGSLALAGRGSRRSGTAGGVG